MEFTAFDIGLIPVIIVLTEIIKQLGFSKRFLPILTIAIGQIGAFIYIAPNDAKQAVLIGLVMAFSAMGLWSGTKNSLDR